MRKITAAVLVFSTVVLILSAWAATGAQPAKQTDYFQRVAGRPA